MRDLCHRAQAVKVLTGWHRLVRVAAVATAILGAAPSVAHHSYSNFAYGQTRTLEGVVKSFSWVNPHTSVEILVPAALPIMENWNIESDSPSIMQRYGWTSGSLKPGMRVRIVCIPARYGLHTGRLLSALLLDRGLTLETKMLNGIKSPPRRQGAP
jgi:hypothetical protein